MPFMTDVSHNGAAVRLSVFGRRRATRDTSHSENVNNTGAEHASGTLTDDADEPPAVTITTARASRTTAVPVTPTRSRFARLGACARWALATLACLWMALCTAVGPLYWDEGSIADWTWANTAYFVLSFAIFMLIVVALVRVGSDLPLLPEAIRRRLLPRRTARRNATQRNATNASDAPDTHGTNGASTVSDTDASPTIGARIARGRHRIVAVLRHMTIKATDRWWKLLLIFIIGWLWVPTTLVTAFGADIRSQIREFSWAWNQWTGIEQPYIGFFSFVPMDIYPTAHYLWPENPTYLTDQHNIVLTVVYGATAALSRYLTGSNDAAYIVLSGTQYLFASFCCAATADRFLNLGFLRRYADATGTATATDRAAKPRRRPLLPFLHARTLPTAADRHAVAPSGALARLLILLFFMLCPLAVFSTISLTKSPLFAFAFVWWFGLWYELHVTRGDMQPGGLPVRPARRSLIAFIASSCVMLISAKYAWYIIVMQIVLALLADRKRWRTYVAALLLPTVLIHGGVSLLISSGVIISGDPIESRGIQLQQIARVAKLNPDGIPESAREKLEPIFNLDQTALAYTQDDADPVKSSGIQAKKVSYKWRTVTAEDMEQFNSAWLEIVVANPVIALDAFLAKCYGYFDVTAWPYTSMDYYVNSTYVQEQTDWIQYWCHDWRDAVAGFAADWGEIPVLGWLTHGNLYVSLTLLIGAAEVILRRWRTLAWHIPLLLLMGVMITAPANNFERHMLAVAFVFGFLCLTFLRDRDTARMRPHGGCVAAVAGDGDVGGGENGADVGDASDIGDASDADDANGSYRITSDVNSTDDTGDTNKINDVGDANELSDTGDAGDTGNTGSRRFDRSTIQSMVGVDSALRNGGRPADGMRDVGAKVEP